MEAVSLVKTAQSYIESLKDDVRKQYGDTTGPQGATNKPIGEQVALVVYGAVSVFSTFLALAGIMYIFVTGFYPVHELINDPKPMEGWKRGLGATGMIGVNIFFPTLWAFIRMIRGGSVLPYAPMTNAW